MNHTAHTIVDKLLRVAAAAVISCGLAACSNLPVDAPTNTDYSEQAQQQALAKLVQFGLEQRGRSNAELVAELDKLNRQYAQQNNEANRLRLAYFHAYSPNGERSRALALLDIGPSEAKGPGRQHLAAAALIPLLQDMRRAEELQQSAQQTLQQRLRDEQKRSEALQQKLDALRDIETKMLERRPVRKP